MWTIELLWAGREYLFNLCWSLSHHCAVRASSAGILSFWFMLFWLVYIHEWFYFFPRLQHQKISSFFFEIFFPAWIHPMVFLRSINLHFYNWQVYLPEKNLLDRMWSIEHCNFFYMPFHICCCNLLFLCMFRLITACPDVTPIANMERSICYSSNGNILKQRSRPQSLFSTLTSKTPNFSCTENLKCWESDNLFHIIRLQLTTTMARSLTRVLNHPVMWVLCIVF